MVLFASALSVRRIVHEYAASGCCEFIVNRYMEKTTMTFASRPADLKITDVRFADIVGAPMHCTLLRIDTNQGLTGYGEVRDASSRTFAAMLKGRLLPSANVTLSNSA